MWLGQVQLQALGLQLHIVGASHTLGPSSCYIIAFACARCQLMALVVASQAAQLGRKLILLESAAGAINRLPWKPATNQRQALLG